ncbi:MAG: energy transducer TonB [Bacteroidales bacterium]
MKRLGILGLILFCSIAMVGQKAVPGGGWRGLKDFLGRQMIYPEPLLKEGRDGKVVLECIIAEDGTPVNLRIKEGIDSLLNREARRLVWGSRWSPALKAGKAIRDTVEVKVEFDARKFRRMAEKRGWFSPDTTWDTSMRIMPVSRITAAAKPLLPEGMSFSAWVSKNLKTPDAARRMGISGRVRLRFIIEPDGTATNIIPEEYLGMGCSEEAIRLTEMLRWKPAEVGNRKVRTWGQVTFWFGEGKQQYDFQPVYNPGSML